MKHICFDYGQKRTGVAVSDAGGSMAFPRGAIIKKTRELFFADILRLLTEEAAEILVLGLPLQADGTDGLTARQVRNLAQSLKRRVSIPIFFMPEAYSSAEAEIMLKESGQKVWMRDGRVDSLAAMRILESFLNQPAHLRMAVE